MNGLDYSVASFFSDIARQCPKLDSLMSVLEGSFLLKGGVIMAALWWLWFLEHNAPAFYALAFVFTFEIAQLLNDVRAVGGFVYHVMLHP